MVPSSDLVPKDKFDVDALNKLRAIVHSGMDLTPILGKLFEWIQDINWPVAPELCKILATLKSKDIIPQIKMVLNSNDDCWQFSCICFLIPELPLEMKKEVIPDLLRIISNPTENEILGEINESAREAYEDIIESLNFVK
ncbi:DUF5071 domain-containing protein [Cohnella sp. GbtcB17]|uniref:DUF5071 domain-containing protein n=1 Tax=Cohnella sp. GbtcB17 TaxID=2824762 RepID=UPI001C2F6C9D|nr:DUF5071 domain-containing protein [Cohnella sp. GbtcB17]